MPRVFKSLYCESSGGKALRRQWAAALRSGSDEGQTALLVLPVCGELLILGKSVIRHTQVIRAAAGSFTTDETFVPMFLISAGFRSEARVVAKLLISGKIINSPHTGIGGLYKAEQDKDYADGRDVPDYRPDQRDAEGIERQVGHTAPEIELRAPRGHPVVAANDVGN